MTKKASHTPGPWHLSSDPYDDGTPYFQIVAGDGFFGDVVEPRGFKLNEIMTEADARLIAAAPDLLHALEMVRDANRDDPHIPQIALATIEAAIAKATGVQS